MIFVDFFDVFAQACRQLARLGVAGAPGAPETRAGLACRIFGISKAGQADTAGMVIQDAPWCCEGAFPWWLYGATHGTLGGPFPPIFPLFPPFPPLIPLLALCGLIGLLAMCPALLLPL